ncbi:DMT family transporter [Nitrincola nitratireducens]|uniref:Guanidinium exporter n=1 Tax=Nitrincola nitratireducens TaxID=1229521 RepID=W9V7V4_9GAMM|nr:multidrug efflux SMR transporter [Nitrincola nitratireducens]EXJ12961.1 Quaternary ammonium compound-resistance protein sugE [Nitrincola nitratireducens]
MTGWWFLMLAGISEICYAAAIPKTEGFTRLWPSLYCIFFICLSMYLLALSVRTVPIGTAYAVWVGIGAIGTAIYGMTVLGEAATFAKMFCLLMITMGIVGLKFFSPAH